MLFSEDAGHLFCPAKELDIFSVGAEKGGNAGGYFGVAACADGDFPVGLIGEGGGELGTAVEA